MLNKDTFDIVVVGGGPAGATAATEIAREGLSVLLLDKDGRIKPCGGAIPPRLIRDFEIPDSQIVARINSARIVSPSGREVDMPVGKGYVGMVDREHFDEWLRARADKAGAERRSGCFESIQQEPDGCVTLIYQEKIDGKLGDLRRVKARAVVGADGARSVVAEKTMHNAERVPCVFAYHEIIKSPKKGSVPRFEDETCDVFYNGTMSPDFYAWVFPHGDTTSVGTGSANKGFGLREAVKTVRDAAGLENAETIRTEGAPIPLKPRKRWDDGRNVVLAGDAAGIVAPASGEGIYYAMLGGQLSAQAATAFVRTGKVKCLKVARKRFMRQHGRVFWILGMMQKFWYTTDERRERFTSICDDPDVQRLTWEAYTEKRLVRANPLAHVRIFFKDLAHLFRLVSPN